MSLFLLDNFDSFTHNLLHLLQQVYGGSIKVARPGEYSLSELNHYDGLVISPGPGRPETTPWAMELLDTYSHRKPILGVCLGMQCINEHFGGHTSKAGVPVHGKTDLVYHQKQDLFSDLPSPFQVARYHSLRCVDIPVQLKLSGQNAEGIPMGLFHKDLPVSAVQFHPESFLTPQGGMIVKQFLLSSGVPHVL